MSQETITQVEPNKPAAPAQPKLDDFGNGRYSNAMSELFKDSKRLLGLTEKQASRLAKAFGAELGRIAPAVTLKYGKVNKDNKFTLRESATIKGVTVTWAISFARTVVLLQESTGFAISEFSKIKLDSQHEEWLNKE